MLIPLVLTGFTHFWNIGFPPLHSDEGHYLRRAMVFLNGFGIVEKTGAYANAYDHPFFGQVLFGSILGLSGYPNSVISSQTLSSVEMAIAYPRVIMGIFAIVDTFLVFKISQRLYNNQVAFFSSVLFAVTPMTWLLRRITLDGIALPFVLTSVLIALSLVTWNKKHEHNNLNIHIFLVLLSGTCLGLAILTKIPVFTMIPLVGYLIYKNSNHLNHRLPLKIMIIWLIPIFLIPSLWPLYAIYSDQFDSWKEGVLDQADRGRREIIESFWNIDSILLFLGLGGVLFSVVKRQWILVLWIVPFLLLVYIHGWFASFHWIIVFPAFCIAAANFVIELFQRVEFGKVKVSHSLIIICVTITGIGIYSTFSLINQDLNSHVYKGIADSLDYLDMSDGRNDDKVNEKITVITNSPNSWLFKYVYKLNNTLDSHRDVGQQKIETEKILALQDRRISSLLDQFKNQDDSDYYSGLSNKYTSVFFDDDYATRWFDDYGGSILLDLGAVKKLCKFDIAWYKGDLGRKYHYLVSAGETDVSLDNIIIQTNTSGINAGLETNDMNNTAARYVNVTVFGNADDRIGAITEMRIEGKEDNEVDCTKIPIRNMTFGEGSKFKISENYDIIASYANALNSTKKISEYRIETDDLNKIAELFTTREYSSPTRLELVANY